MRLYFVLTIASLKMYFRNRQAIFWALFFPMLIMLIFGLLNFDQFSPPDVGYVDKAKNEASTIFRDTVDPGDDPLLDLKTGDEAELRDDLRTGDIDALIIIPEGFGAADGVSQVQTVFDSRKPTEQGITETVVRDVLDSMFLELAQVPDEFRVESRFSIEPSFIEGEGEGLPGIPGSGYRGHGDHAGRYLRSRLQPDSLQDRRCASKVAGYADRIFALPRRSDDHSLDRDNSPDLRAVDRRHARFASVDRRRDDHELDRPDYHGSIRWSALHHPGIGHFWLGED